MYISDDIPVIERLRAHHADDTQYFTNSIQASGGKRHSAGHCEGPRDWSTRARGGIKAEALRKQIRSACCKGNQKAAEEVVSIGLRRPTWIQYYQYVFHSQHCGPASRHSLHSASHTHFFHPPLTKKKKTIKSHVQAQRCATAVAKATCWWLVVIILTIIRAVNGFCIHLRWSSFHKYPWIWGVALDKHVRNGIALECIIDIP